MKKLLFPLLFPTALFAQQAHLPQKLKVELSDQQIIAISAKIDSINQLLINSNYPSGMIQCFVARNQRTFAPLWEEVRKQMIKDSVKKPTK